ncbi:MAG: bifunctional ornithine acetyltransferase/N-acetylglutamate synthase [Sulfurimonas sp.]|nr:MAG: bifunctional ornithine acetyltransferase/N-acetylglutamate synthase [Sulfurimonas sp.]
MYKIEMIEGGVCAAEGFYADGVSAGLKPGGAKDVAFIYSDTLCEIASVFTTNKMTAAPIRHFWRYGKVQSNCILINAKNANAMTGDAGIDDIDEVLEVLTSRFEQIHNPIMSSTGVIGVRLPKETIKVGIRKFHLRVKNSQAAAAAIMTTDRFAKQIALRVTLEDGGVFHIGAIAKGAGMINPAMATMLCFITTDAQCYSDAMQEILNDVVTRTFNAISVDGDTSTNDTVLLLSNQKSGCYDAAAFQEALEQVMLHLAKAMTRDGEGASKLVTFDISGARNDAEAQIAAKALSNSLLMKTALFGEDPNWGRVASTIGASGIACDEKCLRIAFDDVCVYDKGTVFFDKLMEERAVEVMRRSEFTIACDLGLGAGSFRAYGCDLGYEYVKINADYRT